MSKKTSETTIDMLSEAHLPADLTTPTPLGSNFGMDGFPQLDYNSGLLDQFFDASMLEDLPDGVVAQDPAKMADHEFYQDNGVTIEDPEGHLVSGSEADASWFADASGEEAGMYLDGYIKGGGIQSLEWLDLNEQDADRLPKNPVNLSIPELEEAWGTERRTDGFTLQADNKPIDELAFWQSTAAAEDAPYVAPQRFSNQDLARVVRKAMRRSASGWPLKGILVEAAEALGSEAHRVKGAMEHIKADHGLFGKVFIRASAYPGLYQGKDWSKSLKKAKFARFILVDKRTLEGSTFITRGVCTVTGKTAVLEVPWADAYKLYKPHLEGAGRKVATGDHRQALRQAFLSSPEQLARPSTHLPKHVTPSERVSSDEASRQLAAISNQRQVITYTSKRANQERQVAWRRINAWVENGLVLRDQAMSVVGDDVTGAMMLHRVAALIVKTKGASVFSGMANDMRPLPATQEQVKAALAGWTPPAPIDVSHRAREAAGRQVIATLTRWVKVGFLSRAQAAKIAKAKASPATKLAAASKLIMSPRAATDYSGATNDRRVMPEKDPRALQAALERSEREKRAMQARMNEMADTRRASTTRAAKQIQAAKAKVGIIKAATDRGIRGAPLRDLIKRTIPANQMKLAGKFLVPLLNATGAHKDTPKTAREYSGPTMRPHQARTASAAPTPRKKEAASAVRFTRLAMHQGFAGKALDHALQSKFSAAVLGAAKNHIQAYRQEHEGGAGHIYVDAAAYATQTGTKGCEKGAAAHRADRGLHFILAMDRCAGCSLASMKSDGSKVCRAYNKDVLAADEVPSEVKGLMAANKAESAMTGGEKSASMFAPSYDPDEFGLSNNALNDIDYHKAADDDTIEFSFGGMEF